MTTETAILPRLVAEYLQIRSQSNDIDKRKNALSAQIKDMLEDLGGSYVDEESGQKLVIESSFRYEWDAEKLLVLVRDGLITQNDYADLLETVVSKEKVQLLLDHGLITDRQLARAGAKVATKVIKSLKVVPVGKR